MYFDSIEYHIINLKYVSGPLMINLSNSAFVQCLHVNRSYSHHVIIFNIEALRAGSCDKWYQIIHKPTCTVIETLICFKNSDKC